MELTDGEFAEGEAVEEMIPLHANFGPAMFQPYALDLAAMGFSSAHSSQSLAFLVLLRNDGALLALPELAMPGEALAAGEPTDTSALVGPHLKVELGAAMLDEVSILQEPVPRSDRSISAELVDFNSEALQYMRALDSAQELMDLLAFDFREPLMVPSPGVLVARALDWARGDLASVGERIQFYSADDVPVTPLPHAEGADTPRELSNKAYASQKSHSSCWQRRRRRRCRAVAQEETHSGHSGKVHRGDQLDTAIFGHSGSGVGFQDSSDGGDHQPCLRQNICTEKAHWQLGFAWLWRTLAFEELGIRDAPSEVCGSCQAEGGVQHERHRGDVEGLARGYSRFCSGYVGPVSGFDSSGGSDRQRVWRPFPRHGVGIFFPFKQGLTGQGEASSGASCTQRDFLCERA